MLYRRNRSRTARTVTALRSPRPRSPHLTANSCNKKALCALSRLSRIVLNYNEVLSPHPPQSHPSKSLLEIPHMGFADCEKKSSSQEVAQLLHESTCLGVLVWYVFFGLLVLVLFSFVQLLWMCVCVSDLARLLNHDPWWNWHDDIKMAQRRGINQCAS